VRHFDELRDGEALAIEEQVGNQTRNPCLESLDVLMIAGTRYYK
jgi:hypothetical protein